MADSMPAMPWFVYILECTDLSLYTGVAIDVAGRYTRHAAGKGARYTRSHPPAQLLAVIEFPGRSQALKAEHAIKQLSPMAKRRLCRQHPPAQALVIKPRTGGNTGRSITPVTASSLAASTPAPPSRPGQALSQGENPMLRIGDRAPSFSLASGSGETISSAHLKGQRYVLYFYPKDDTPGCTREACAFRDNLPAFETLGVPVLGLSADSDRAHAKFAGKYGLNFPLLSDPEHMLLEAYGAWVEKSMYGRKYMGIQRSTFVIGSNGKIEQVWEKVSPDSHAGEVLAWLSTKPAAASSKKTVATKKSPATAKGKSVAKKAAVTPAGTGKSAAQKKLTAKIAAPSNKPSARQRAEG